LREKRYFENFNITKNVLSKETCYSARVVIHIAIGCFVFTMKERYKRCKARAFDSIAFVTS
jgi:hypothetical protein